MAECSIHPGNALPGCLYCRNGLSPGDMHTAPKVAESLAAIGEEYAIRGTLRRHGKWEHRTEKLGRALARWHAEQAAASANELLRAAGREPDVEVVLRTTYVGEWESAL